MDRNSKAGWEIRLKTQIRNLQQQVKLLRQMKNTRICWDKKRKATQLKTANMTQGNKSESTGKRKKTKKIPRQDQTIQTKQNILKQQKNSTCK